MSIPKLTSLLPSFIRGQRLSEEEVDARVWKILFPLSNEEIANYGQEPGKALWLDHVLHMRGEKLGEIDKVRELTKENDRSYLQLNTLVLTGALAGLVWLVIQILIVFERQCPSGIPFLLGGAVVVISLVGFVIQGCWYVENRDNFDLNAADHDIVNSMESKLAARPNRAEFERIIQRSPVIPEGINGRGVEARIARNREIEKRFRRKALLKPVLFSLIYMILPIIVIPLIFLIFSS